MDTWTLEEATHELPEVVRRALEHQPQVVMRNRHEEDAVVVVARSEYERLRGPAPAVPESGPATSGRELLAFFQNSPLAEAVAAGEIDLDSLRSHDPPREIDFG